MITKLLVRYSLLLCILSSLLWISGCATHTPQAGSSYFQYNRPASLPKNSNNVRVKVSLHNQMAYVMEGDRPLLVTPVSVGSISNPTPKGTFRVFNKQERRRANTHGYAKNPATGETRKTYLAKKPGGWTFIGTPMPFWVEFAPAYGFHTGWVHPTPRTHGCIRLHENVAPKFFRIVPIGAPVVIASSLPEDQTIGKNIPRPADPSHLPDYPHAFEMSDQIYTKHLPVSFVN